jgi:hypothetical protein
MMIKITDHQTPSGDYWETYDPTPPADIVKIPYNKNGLNGAERGEKLKFLIKYFEGMGYTNHTWQTTGKVYVMEKP